jgi:GT2 family glycosyltransferase
VQGGRPAVSVVVPLGGDHADAGDALAAIGALEVRDGDELIVADNSPRQIMAAHPPAGVRVAAATAERSSYHARNAGAALASGEWILFIDADCEPDPALIDAYFEPAPSARCGVLAGQIDGDPEQASFLARYTRSRKFFRQDAGFLAEAGTAATGNLMVRRAAFEGIGGFADGIRSGGDVDLCRRICLAGWTLETRVDAVVRHHHRDSLPSLLGAIARYAAGSRWLNDRYPGESGSWPLVSGLAGVAKDVPPRVVARRYEEAAFRVVDGLGLVAHVVGYRRSNRAAAL